KKNYLLEEINGTAIRRSYTGNRLKKFVKRNKYWDSLDNSENENTIKFVDFNDNENANTKKKATKEFRNK
ncbi:hypothetical protein BDZ45DRAFT_602039, partial [Acephala macrosclerotiorum]